MSVSFHGIGQVHATFMGGGITEGHVVKVGGPGQVGPCADGESFCGVAACCRDDACSVQVAGFVTVAYSGSAPAVGYTALSADGAGGVKSDAAGRSCLVADIDDTAMTATILL